MPLVPSLRLPSSALILSLLLAACGDSGPSSTTSTTGSGGAGGSGGTGGSGGALPPPKPLGVLAWNVHDHFDIVYNGGTGEEVPSSTEYKAKRKAIGAVLKSIDADVVLLSEVETQQNLVDLNGNELDGRYLTVSLTEGNDTRRINVGLMSKVMPDLIKSHKDDTFTKAGTNGPIYHYARDCVEVHLTYNGRPLVLLGVHFKAKTPPDDPDKRLAEAQHTRAIADALLKENPARGIIILGDYNDVPGSAAVNAVAGQAPSLFTDAAEAVPADQRYSFDFNGKLELIDHQMADPRAHAMLDPSTVLLEHGAGVDDGSKYASDHAPLFAIYQVR